MGLKSKRKEAKEEAVRDRYRDKEEKVRGGRSSEDVWDRREEGHRRLGAFARCEEGSEGGEFSGGI